MGTLSSNANASPLRRYVSSGKTPLGGLVLGLLSGFLVAFVLGGLYAVAIAHVMHVFGRFVLAVFFGLAIGFVTTRVMRAFHVRSAALVIASVLALAVFGWALSWIVWLAHVYTNVHLVHLLNPWVLFDAVSQIYEEGTWGMGRRQMFHVVSGPMLAIVWCCEAAFIIGFPVLLALVSTSEKVYCEDCGVWCTVVPEAKVFDESALDTLKAELFEQSDMTAIDRAPRPFSRTQWLRLKMAYCDECNGTNAIALESVKLIRRNDDDVPQATQRIPYHSISVSQFRVLKKSCSL